LSLFLLPYQKPRARFPEHGDEWEKSDPRILPVSATVIPDLIGDPGVIPKNWIPAGVYPALVAGRE